MSIPPRIRPHLYAHTSGIAYDVNLIGNNFSTVPAPHQPFSMNPRPSLQGTHHDGPRNPLNCYETDRPTHIYKKQQELKEQGDA